MPLIIDPQEKLFILDSDYISGVILYSAWVDWIVLSDNLKYLPAFRTVGGDETISGQKIPAYYFMDNDWKIRPMEASHSLTVDGFVYSTDGLNPVIDTLGNFKVQVKYTIPMLAVAYSTAGVPAPTVEQIVAGIIAAGIGQGAGNLTTEQNDQLMNKIATKNDLFII